MTSPPELPFDDSRRLTGYNRYFAAAGAVLETLQVPASDALVDAWKARVTRMRAALGWPDAAIEVRRHCGQASLAFAAPPDQLLAATEVNEWAWLAAVHAAGIDAGRFHAPGHPAAWDEASALETLRRLAAAERSPPLVGLVDAAERRGLNVLIDDDTLSIGSGQGSRHWPLAQLPDAARVDWSAVHDVPVALVTGSNGKTTTTRLLAAMSRAHGWRTAHTCTDGVHVGEAALAEGDYSGPAGARLALREPGIEAAILETARGGILRRGLAVQHAQVAVVTNLSDDHFGEYGVHDLDGLAEAKLTVARALGKQGVLVLNADDPLLVASAARLAVPIAWFALDADAPGLLAHRAHGGRTCGVRRGRLVLGIAGVEHELGAVEAMPLTFGGSARYNIANAAAAALAAQALGIRPDEIRMVLAGFGSGRADNPGRLQFWNPCGIRVFLDYAHNPDGLAGLLAVASRDRRGRLGLLLGQAGNRGDADIRELARVAASFQPDRIVLKDMGGMLRGRASGEVPAILREELGRRGLGQERVLERLDEVEAARSLLEWARPGDTVVLPVHGKQGRPAITRLLAAMGSSGPPVADSSPAS
ncbi:MAG: Mur ligase [Xanthomonadales bacterium]|nr:Mur ligase [Xanthomonadales bacterium]